MSKPQPISEVDELDRLFNMAINAKQVAVNTAQESDDLFEISEIKDVANALLDQYRTKFKADITALLHKAEARGRAKELKYWQWKTDGHIELSVKEVDDRLASLNKTGVEE